VIPDAHAQEISQDENASEDDVVEELDALSGLF